MSVGQVIICYEEWTCLSKDGRRMRNGVLNKAGSMKKDEFYTRYEDIAAEIVFYPGAFADKVVLCNCNDPIESNFVRYFLDNFRDLGLKALVATCYAHSELADTLGILEPVSELACVSGRAYGIEVVTVPEGFQMKPDYQALFRCEGNRLFQLEGDGDFRSDECMGYLSKADVLVTNPPFSLFREYLTLAQDSGKKFLVLGNVNALTCKEVFPLFQRGMLWLGHSIHSGDRKFYVPEAYPLDAAGCGVDEKDRRYIRVKGVRWYTNMESDIGFKDLSLSKTYDRDVYPFYDNYDAINVDCTKNIPCDYEGVMGVPITFLDRYNPDQFDIIMLANGNARTNTDPSVLRAVGYRRHPEDRGGVGIVDGRRSYARVLVRNRKPQERIAL